jgi:cytidine deaminase
MTERAPSYEAAVAGCPREIQADLRGLPASGAVIPSGLVRRWLDGLGEDVGTLMIRLLPVAASFARAPLSGFSVGAVALGVPRSPESAPGSLYLGANMEFPGQALSFCIHGEQSAVNNAWLHGESGVRMLAVTAAPCGYCRQFLCELGPSLPDLDILLKTGDDPADHSHTRRPLTSYLPDAFGPGVLGMAGGFMAPAAHGLTVAGGDAVLRAALAAANASYAPYTGNFCGVGLRDAGGAIHSGRYAENAAYNPSMSPLESALAAMSMTLPAGAALTITEAVLVEAPAPISQRAATEAVLSSVAPSVPLRSYTARLMK